MAVEIGLGLSTQAGLRTAMQDALQAAESAVHRPSAESAVHRPSAVLFCAPFKYERAGVLATIRQHLGRDVAIAGGTVNDLTNGGERSDALFAIRHAVALKSKRELEIVANGEIGCHRHGWSRSTGMTYVLFGPAEGS